MDPGDGVGRDGSGELRADGRRDVEAGGVEIRDDAARLLHPDLLWAMGRDLAAIHLGARDRRDALRKDLEKRKQRWFRAHVETAVEFVTREFAEWKKPAK